MLHAWREWAPTLPDEAGTSVALLRVPRDAGWPAPLHDRTVVHVRFTGADVDAVSGAALLAAMRTVGTPLLDEVGELSLTATDAVHRDPVAPAPVHDGGAALRELPAPAVDALLAAADVDVASPLTTVELRALGGALGRAPAVPAAVAGRGAAYALHVQGRLVEPVAADVPDAVGDAAGRGRTVVARRRPADLRRCGRTDGAVVAARPRPPAPAAAGRRPERHVRGPTPTLTRAAHAGRAPGTPPPPRRTPSAASHSSGSLSHLLGGVCGSGPRCDAAARRCGRARYRRRVACGSRPARRSGTTRTLAPV